MKWTIRTASAADRDELLEMHRALYIEHFTAFASETMRRIFAEKDIERALAADLAHMLRSPEHLLLVVATDDGLCGYASASIHVDSNKRLSRRGHIDDWYVREDMRGQKIGAALVKSLEVYFRERGCDVVESATWAFNKGAIAAHRCLGYEDARIIFRKLL